MKINALLVSSVLYLTVPAFTPQVQAQNSQTQSVTVSGTVTDENGEPVIGATVKVKGNVNLATVTDLDGNFTLKTNGAKQIEITYVGYKPAVVSVDGKSKVDVQIVPTAESLDEVVVVGYGTQKKESLTGAISQIKGDDVYKGRGMTNTTTALQGEIAGLTITRKSSRPGQEEAKMQIRGASSINGGDPLVLIDGQAASLDELNQMDGNDIASFSVLKDASAAIYGARSSNGVVLVTTKRGKIGKPQVSYSGSYTRSIDGIQPPYSSNADWLEMFYQAQYNDVMADNPNLTDPEQIHNSIDWWIFNTFGGPEAAKNPETGKYEVVPGGNIYKGKDLFNALKNGQTLTTINGSGFVERWDPSNYLMDYIFGDSNTWKHNISVAGGDEKFNYRASLNYSDAQSQLKIAEDSEKKYGARLNADYNASDFFQLQAGFSWDRRDLKSPNQLHGSNNWTQDTWFWAVRNENGDAYDTFGANNPYAFITQSGQNKTKWNTIRANGKVTFNFSKWVKGLSLVGSAAYKRVEREETTHRTTVRMYDWGGENLTKTHNETAKLTDESKHWDSYTLGAFVNYNNKFGFHQVDAMFGITGETEDYKRLYGERSNGELYPGSGLTDLNVFNGDGGMTHADGGSNSWSFLSYVLDLRYNYADRYLISFLGRRDGSSKLVKEQRWKNFFSISGGWVFTNEEFFRNLNLDQWMNFGKIRYNFGKTGSITGITNYESYATIKTDTYFFGGPKEASMWIDGMRSANRTWETIESHDAGVDFSFFSSRLRASFDWFQKTNNGMFIDVVYPEVLGASAPKTNNGKLRTRGWEIEANWRDNIGEFSYNLGFQVSDARTTLLELTNNENVPEPGNNKKNLLIGKPLEALYVYQTDGIFQTQAEVDAYYEMYYWNADHSGPKPGNVLPAPAESGQNRLRPGTRRRVDLDGDGAITEKDIYYAGDTAPKISYGIKGGVTWKGIDFSIFFQGIGQQKIMRDGYYAYPFRAPWTSQNSKFLGTTWSLDNPNAQNPILSRNSAINNYNYLNTDALVTDNRYIRLKNLQIGYTLPQKWTKKVFVEKFRVYFSGDDLWEWTKIKDGYDPEHGEASNSLFPLCRMLTFGVEVTL